MASSRTKVFEAMPTTGVPPQLWLDWDDYNRLLNALMKASRSRKRSKRSGDIRPHPDFRTVELRMCDRHHHLARDGDNRRDCTVDGDEDRRNDRCG